MVTAQQAGETSERPADPCVMVIFGAGGDLTKRKLFPSIYNLGSDNLITDEFAIVGVDRVPMDSEAYREKCREDIKQYATVEVDPQRIERALDHLHYVSGDITQQSTYEELAKLLAEIDQKFNTRGNYLFYLSTAPRFFGEVPQHLAAAGLTRQENGTWQRIIIEKPFGRDLESARTLNRDLSQVLHENQIYRIDHYLGKETVQNILVFRFANGLIEPIWNHRYIDHVQITVGETVGVEHRGGYYDTAGALRDMVPNHIFQLISLTALEPPISFGANEVRDEQAKVIRAMQPMTPEQVLSRAVRGQYAEGEVGGDKINAYRSEPQVAPDSNTESFVAMKLFVDNWRWAGVPFYIRTGKSLPRRVSEIAIQFKRAPFMLFRQTEVEKLQPNRMLIRVAPEEGISLSLGAKIPGPTVKLGMVDMDFRYTDYFGNSPRTGYERLIYECMLGDATLFQRADMTEASWNVVEPVLDVWKALPAKDFPNYPAGTWGPQAAQDLIERDGRHWSRCE